MADKSNKEINERTKQIRSDMKASKEIFNLVQLASKVHERELNNPLYIAVQEAIANQSLIMEYNKLRAKTVKSYVDALIEEGFNEDRAVQIAIAHVF